MVNLANSHSLTEFQRNAKAYIDGINDTKEPLLLTVNGSVQAVIVDPTTYQNMEEEIEKQRLISEIREGERAIQEGRTRPADEVFAEMKTRYGF